jgi:hypothetical protein
MKTLAHVAHQILLDDDDNHATVNDGTGSAWCMVVVVAGWDEQQQQHHQAEKSLEEAIQSMLLSTSSFVRHVKTNKKKMKKKIRHESTDEEGVEDDDDEEEEIHEKNVEDIHRRNKNESPRPSCSIFTISNQSFHEGEEQPTTRSGDDGATDPPRTKKPATTTATTTKVATTLVRPMLRNILSSFVTPTTTVQLNASLFTNNSDDNSNSLPPPLLYQQQSNLGNLFALLHWPQSIFELQVDALQFHSKRYNLWKDVYQMAATSLPSSNIEQDDNENRWWEEVIQIGMTGTTVWNPYLTTRTTNVSTTTSGMPPGFGPLPKVFERSVQGDTQQTAYTEANLDFFWSEEKTKRKTTTKKVGTISFVVQPKRSKAQAEPPPSPILIPNHVSCPYTTYATWHLQPTLWSLLVPPSLLTTLASTTPHQAEQFRAYTTRFLLQEYNVNLLVVQAQSYWTTLTTESVTMMTTTNAAPVGLESQTVNKKGDRKIKLSSPQPPGKISRLTDWLHNSYDPTSAAAEFPTNNHLASQMEAMWTALSKIGILAESDLHVLQKWLYLLTAMDYGFPVRKRYKQYHVAAMGQFNSPEYTPLHSVLFWVQQMRQYFHHVAVAGSFPLEVREKIESYGILVVPDLADTLTTESEDTRGFFPPMDHLAWTLQYYKTQTDRHAEDGVMATGPSSVQGVLYLHDDALINVTEWIIASSSDASTIEDRLTEQPNHGFKFSTDAIVGTFPLRSNITRKGIATINQKKANPVFSSLYSIHVVVPTSHPKNGTSTTNESENNDPYKYYLVDYTGQRHDSIEAMLTTWKVPYWPWYVRWCLPGQVRIVRTAAEQFFAWNSTISVADISDAADHAAYSDNEVDNSGTTRTWLGSSSSSSPPPRGFVWDGVDEYDYRGIFEVQHLPDTDTVEVSMTMPHVSQVDVLFVPVSVAKEFATAVAMHTASEPKVFLECAIPDIAEFVRLVSSSLTVRTVGLCSDFDAHKRGKEVMVRHCLKTKNLHGAYHPFKLSKGLPIWGKLLETVNKI